MERKSLYIESTIPSYATARVSRDIIIAGKQTMTKQFWEDERQKYDLFVSDYVVEDCEKGDKDAAKKRIEYIAGIPVYPKTAEIDALGEIYYELLEIPEKAKEDCFHLATCVVERIDYLLTWNCKHLGSVSQRKIQMYNDRNGLWTPALITPENLLPEILIVGETE
jgi:hypothetical protein